MLSGSVSDASSPEGSEGDGAPVLDEVDDMESDIERLLAVTNLEDDAPQDAAELTTPATHASRDAAANQPRFVPSAREQAAIAPSFVSSATSSPPELAFEDREALRSEDFVQASDASSAFLREIVTLVDDADVDHLKSLQLETCVWVGCFTRAVAVGVPSLPARPLCVHASCI